MTSDNPLSPEQQTPPFQIPFRDTQTTPIKGDRYNLFVHQDHHNNRPTIKRIFLNYTRIVDSDSAATDPK